MSYEKTLYQCKPHKVMFAWPIIFIWMGTYMLLHKIMWENPGVLFIFLGIGLIPLVALSYKNSFFRLTNKRIVFSQGLFKEKHWEVPLEIIEEIVLHQNLTGLLFRYGNLRLIGDNGKEVEYSNLKKPRRVKQEIERALAQVRSE